LRIVGTAGGRRARRERAGAGAGLCRAFALALAAAALVGPAQAATEGAVGAPAMAARLDTLQSLGDPMIEEIAAVGEAAIPHVIARLGSSRRTTALGAVRVLVAIGGDGVLSRLLEHVMTVDSEDEWDRATEAMRRVVQRAPEDVRSPDPERVEPEFESLARAVICTPGGLSDACFGEDYLPGSEPLLVYGEGISYGYNLGCFPGGVQIMTSDAFKQSSYLVGRHYTRLGLMIREIDAAGVYMREWVAEFGARPDAVAVVAAACGRVGVDAAVHQRSTIWARSGGLWSVVAVVYEMSIN
jgi:hypothetical protein